MQHTHTHTPAHTHRAASAAASAAAAAAWDFARLPAREGKRSRADLLRRIKEQRAQHTHTHTEREREREREVNWQPAQPPTKSVVQAGRQARREERTRPHPAPSGT